MKIITVAHSVCVTVLLTTNHATTAWNFGFGGSAKEKTTTEFNIYDWVVERITGGSPYNTKTIVDESVDDAEVVAAYQSFVDGHLKKASRSSSPTSISKRTLTDTIHEDRRFVLYNSRRLSGECLPICYEETPPPTLSPVEETITEPPRNTDRPTGSPTGSPRTDSPTKKLTDGPTGSPTADPTGTPTKNPTSVPTGSPTDSPTKSPTHTPTDVPTASPTHSPTDSPTNPPTAGCQCPVNDEHGGSFKCGKDVYLCPGITAICAAQSKSGPEYRYMNDEQCEEMKKVELGEKCIAMPEIGLTQPKSLSNRVCYGGPYARPGYKIDGDGCESCKDLFYPPTPSPTNPPSVAPVGGHELDCDKLQDLGYGFSERSGDPSYTGKCYPGVGSLNAPNFNGRDDSVAVFVGGDYWGKNAAEVEGKMVVMGDLRVDSGGPGNFVSVGVGTQVVPNNGQECIKVGGNLKAYRDIQVFNQHNSMNCDIVFKGSATNKNHWKNNGAVRKDANLDLSEYDAMTKVWYKKSKFWGSLNPTATVEYEDWGGSEGETTYRCNNNKDEVQIFNVEPNERKKVEGVHTIHFSNSCEGKTILINVRGGGNRAVDAAGMHFKDKQGYGSGGFDTCVKSSILWNFPDATTVNIGNGKTSEFQGSLLITGNLQMTTTGQTGRTIVLGDVTHNRGGSEFHSGEFNPPKPLPDPDCDDLTNGTLELSPSNPPTMAPTSKATEFDGCKTHKDEASRNRGVKDSDCSACTGSQKWWPCDLKPAACEGSKCKLY